jgi:hypothetical protein
MCQKREEQIAVMDRCNAMKDAAIERRLHEIAAERNGIERA